MTLNNFIEAIAGKLTAVWPDRKVYVDEIPKDADGQFFVGIIESEQEKHLDRRWKRWSSTPGRKPCSTSSTS